jgi:hypothetical protein
MFFHNVINSTTYSYSLPPSPNHQQQKRPDKSDQLWSTHELREYSSRPQIAMRLAVEQSFAEVWRVKREEEQATAIWQVGQPIRWTLPGLGGLSGQGKRKLSHEEGEFLNHPCIKFINIFGKGHEAKKHGNQQHLMRMKLLLEGGQNEASSSKFLSLSLLFLKRWKAVSHEWILP